MTKWYVKVAFSVLILIVSVCMLAGCKEGQQGEDRTVPSEEAVTAASVVPNETEDNEAGKMLRLYVNDEELSVAWEDNESVEALKEIVSEGPLVIEMSMYGGFEQVGPIGQSLPENDNQTTTDAGDIVLYSGNQIVVFYGSNSWSYTRLGHIEDRTKEELSQLLGEGNVSLTIRIDE